MIAFNALINMNISSRRIWLTVPKNMFKIDDGYHADNIKWNIF